MAAQIIADREREQNSGGEGTRKASWKAFWKGHQQVMQSYRSVVHPSYREGFNRLNLTPDHLPTSEALNLALAETGWKVRGVRSYLSSWNYARLLNQKQFPVGYEIRSPEQADYATFPDYIHDVVGHLPMLFDPEYRDLLETLAARMMKAGPDLTLEKLEQTNLRLGEARANGASAGEILRLEEEIQRLRLLDPEKSSVFTLLSQFMFWTLEFGLLKSADSSVVVYGAGILSSGRELRHVLTHPEGVKPLSRQALGQDYLFTSTQTGYYAADSFRELKQFCESL